jgi:hypothetical protein
LIAILLSIAFGLLIVFLMIGGQDRFLFEPSPDARMSMESLAHHPLVHTLLLPLSPWALAITAESAREFWPWFGACVLLLFGAYELTARIPVDFRELSLATSADIAKRLNRMRRGGWSAGQAEAGKTALGWNVPWLFGRSPFGAVAWLKLVAIVRKSRGTILFSAFVIALVTLGITSMGRSLDTREELLLGSILVSTIATVYLCTGLRFDFRGDLELMQQVKAWPLAPWRTFLATVLPEVVLVSGLISIALVARMLYLGAFHPLVLVVIALEPLIVLTWVALDNAVFLFMPVRYTPGQEGAFQHIGRSIALLLLRGALFAVVLLVVGGPASLCVVALHKGAQLELDTAIFFGSILGWFLLLGVDAVLVWLGGMMLRRFDVARDRG